MVERSLGVREIPGSIPGSPNRFSPSIAFLYSHGPSGHSCVASALQEAFESAAPQARTFALSLASDFYPIVGPFISRTYLKLIEKAPWLWNSLYDNRPIAGVIRALSPPLSFGFGKKLNAYSVFHNLDLIVCTHALACAALAREKEKGRLSVPLVGVLTDFGVHEYWISPHVDLYLVPSVEVLREMRSRGIEESRIRVTGIPIHRKFRTPAVATQARQELGLWPERFTVLVQGGSKGIGPLREIAYKLLEIGALQVIVVCGSNRLLFKELHRREKKITASRLRVLSFTHRMDLCLAAADLLVGKAGGVSLAEAMAVGVPAILFSPLPGQEKLNAEMLVRHGAARLARDTDALVRMVSETLGKAETLTNLQRAASRIGRPRSSEIAQQHLLLLLSRRRGQAHRTGV